MVSRAAVPMLPVGSIFLGICASYNLSQTDSRNWDSFSTSLRLYLELLFAINALTFKWTLILCIHTAALWELYIIIADI